MSRFCKNSKNDGNQNLGADFGIVFSFDIFVLFFDVLRRFLGPDFGNQLPGCRLFSRCDIYIHIEEKGVHWWVEEEEEEEEFEAKLGEGGTEDQGGNKEDRGEEEDKGDEGLAKEADLPDPPRKKPCN